MADILIRGMEIPKYTTKAEFGIDADGNPLCMVHHRDGTEPGIYDVVPLPEGHGRLIDADALMPDFVKARWAFFSDGDTFLRLLKNAPTIVPAEGGADDGT